MTFYFRDRFLFVEEYMVAMDVSWYCGTADCGSVKYFVWILMEDRKKGTKNGTSLALKPYRESA